MNKRRFFFPLLGALLLISTVLPAQTQVSIASYPYDVEAAGQAIGQKVQTGFVPIGLEVIENDKIWVLYVESAEDTGPNYSIHSFSAPENLDQEMTTIMDRGWAPVGLSRTSSNLYGLFIEREHDIQGWRIHRSPSTSDSIQQSLNDFHQDGFSSAGISVSNEQAWYLFLKGEQPTPQRVAFRAVSEDQEAIQDEVTEAMSAGWRPAGLSQLQQGLGLLFNAPVSQ